MTPSSDIAFTPTIKAIQTERGSRGAYARMEAQGGFRTAIDARLIAPFDMAVDMGLDVASFYPTAPGGIHPELASAAGRVLDACRKHDVFPATAAWDVTMAESFARSGYRLMLYGLDFGLFGKAARNLKNEIDRIVAGIGPA
jgi:2-keto-3-deoxy-L-rhamnonate aldolase RhmA